MSDFSAADEEYMRLALSLAESAATDEEVPVGAVLVREGEIIGQGRNAPISEQDPTAHAEINALREACRREGNYRLPDSTLYVTLEPCAMCAGALVHARVARVVCATREPRAGAAGSVVNLLQHPSLNHRCDVEFGLLQSQSSELLGKFFKARR